MFIYLKRKKPKALNLALGSLTNIQSSKIFVKNLLVVTRFFKFYSQFSNHLVKSDAIQTENRFQEIRG